MPCFAKRTGPTDIESLNCIHGALGTLGLGCGLPIVTSFDLLPYPSVLVLATQFFRSAFGIKGFRGFPQFDGVASCSPMRTKCIRLASSFKGDSWQPGFSNIS